MQYKCQRNLSKDFPKYCANFGSRLINWRATLLFISSELRIELSSLICPGFELQLQTKRRVLKLSKGDLKYQNQNKIAKIASVKSR